MLALLDEIRRFDPRVPIEEAWTPPASWYTAPEFCEFEREVVFGRARQPVARVDQVASPGDYITGCLAGEPWVFINGDSESTSLVGRLHLDLPELHPESIRSLPGLELHNSPGAEPMHRGL